MELSISAVFLLVCIVGYIIYTVRQKNKTIVDLPENSYKGKKFMSKDKIEFHKRLLRLLPNDEYQVFPDVAMSTLIAPNVSLEHVAHAKIKESYSTRLVDFVITNIDYKVFFIIELQEQNGETNRDLRALEPLKKAGYKVIIWSASNLPNNKEIQLKITGKYDNELDNNGMM